MPYVEGDICGSCRDLRDHHCQTCWSCQYEPIQECCMKSWSESSKAYERARARRPVADDRARELAEAEMPPDWCPECDGPGECRPGTCCGRPYPELAGAEGELRRKAEGRWITVDESRMYLPPLLAEYDRRGAEMARLRPIETAARAVTERYRGISPVQLDHLDDFGLAMLLDALADELRPDPTEED